MIFINDLYKAIYFINNLDKAIYFPDGLPVLTVETMAVVLNFFAEICCEGRIRDWLGSPEGFKFWLPLLSLLCSPQPSSVDGKESTNQTR